MVAPIMAEIAKEKAGKIDVYKVDIDKEKELADAFGIQSIPTVLFIPMKGKPIMTQGAMPKE
jgi:thioredoxin-like negative regulator of GroEL